MKKAEDMVMMKSDSLHSAVPAILGLSCFGIYLSTLCPTVYLGDSGELTAAAFCLGVPHNSGYPLYALLGKLFCMIPLGNIGFRMNLMSATFAALTLWVVYEFILKITSSKFASLIAALSLAFSSLFWMQTVCAEVYSLHLFFLALLVRLLWCWDEQRSLFRLFLFIFVTGVSFGNHMQTVMLAPAALFIVLSADRIVLFRLRNLILAFVLFCIALSLYLYLPFRTEAGAAITWGDPNTLDRFLAHVTARAHRGGYVFNKTALEYLLRAKEGLWLVYTQSGVILLPAAWGWAKALTTRWRAFFALMILFDFVYTVFLNTISLEITALTLPTCLAITVLSGLGIADILRRIHISTWIQDGAKKMLKAAFVLIPAVPFGFNFDVCNQSRNYTAYEHAVNIFRTLDRRSVLVIDGDNNVFPVIYGRLVERMGRDIRIYDRFNLAFRWPSFHTGGVLRGGGDKARAFAEERVLKENLSHGVYLAAFDPRPIPMLDLHPSTPYGILMRVSGRDVGTSQDSIGALWRNYSTESFYEGLERDYMNREVCAYYFFNLGKYFFSAGFSQQGLESCRLASKIAYNDEMLHSDLAIFLTDHGFLEEARKELEMALLYHEDLSGVHNNWGYFYNALGDYEKAITSIRKAIELNPQNHRYYGNLGIALYRAGKRDEALVALKKSMLNHSNQPEIERLLKELGSQGSLPQ